MKPFIFYISLSVVLLSCKNETNLLKSSSKSDKTEYANTLFIQKFEDFTIVKILKPWQRADNEIFTYILAKSEFQIPDSLSKLNYIQIPVKSVICFSTTHIGFINALQKTETIKGISGKDYFFDALLRDNFNNGEVFDIGYHPALDYEKIIDINPDIVFLYGLEASVGGIAIRLSNAGIPSVMVAEFLEDHPLGKAEWIKLFSLLFDCEEKGDTIFEMVKNNYLNLKNRIDKITEKPFILTGLPWKETWYMTGGESFMAKFIQDAGGEFLWKENNSKDFFPLSLESVYSKSLEADIWINCGTATSLNDLISRDERFKNIGAVKQKNVFNNNARTNETGGNDFWESGAVRADLILKDLITIFHPQLMEDTKLVYYKQLK